MTNLLKNLLIALVVAGILFAGYYFLLRDNFSSISAEPVPLNITAEEQSQQLLSQLTLLRSIRIDDSVFSDSRFTSLINFRQELGTQPSGRANPFAPAD